MDDGSGKTGVCVGEILHGIPGKASQMGCGIDVGCSRQLSAGETSLDTRWKEEVEVEEALRIHGICTKILLALCARKREIGLSG